MRSAHKIGNIAKARGKHMNVYAKMINISANFVFACGKNTHINESSILFRGGVMGGDAENMSWNFTKITQLANNTRLNAKLSNTHVKPTHYNAKHFHDNSKRAQMHA